MHKTTEIFIVYAREDTEHLKELQTQLKVLERQGNVIIWDASQIYGGIDWKKEIDKHLQSAPIILLLVSANLIASDETYHLAKEAVSRNAPPHVHVVPILLHESGWEYSIFSHLNPLPENRKPITSWTNRNAAYASVRDGIQKIVAQREILLHNTQTPSPTPTTITQSPPVPPSPARKKRFDVFLCHNSKDKPAVKKIAQQLKEHGIVPWLDEWELLPGRPWQRALERQISEIKSAAVFVGASGFGPWHNMEMEAFLREFNKRQCPVIPVLLSTAPDEPQLPIFLSGMGWIDFRKSDPDPLQQLIRGITAEEE
ncbi:MAG: toll/interleukin-1 receptor domain-containing protein [Chloroflexi bacterium]|nr:MAG: toll/interleukin-1 receptor domain-containing protein [Chloroflexota bacterium]